MKHINLRLEDDLHAKVKEAAERDHRSLNQEIAWLVERGLIFADPELRRFAAVATGLRTQEEQR